MSTILNIKDLRLSLGTGNLKKEILRGISFELKAGEILAFVGESGSGKSQTAHSILRLNEFLPGYEISGEILFQKGEGVVDILKLDMSQLNLLRNKEIAVVFQQSRNVLNPSMSIGKQLSERYRLFNQNGKKEDSGKMLEALINSVGLTPPKRFLEAYPHQLSGGQLQRCLIALALVKNPSVIIADEPLSSLDSELKKDLIELLSGLRKKFGFSMIWISHDLETVKSISDRIIIMHKGRIVEQGPVLSIMQSPKEDYTRSLLGSRVPAGYKMERLPLSEEVKANADIAGLHRELRTGEEQLEVREKHLAGNELILALEGISKSYHKKSTAFGESSEMIDALKDFSLNLRKGEIFGLYGRSGSGKSTLARIIAFLEKPDKGRLIFKSKDTSRLSFTERRNLQKQIQLIYQDPLSAMAPHITVEELLNEVRDRTGRKQSLKEILVSVGLDETYLGKLPGNLSGGERQRVLIARSLLLDPEILVCDEVLSSLDVSTQARIINILLALNRNMGLTILFISHDQNVTEFVSDRVLKLEQVEPAKIESL